jgi:hypothetical protein
MIIPLKFLELLFVMLIETIATRGELDEFEQQNIEQAVLWSLNRSFKPDVVFTEEFLKLIK